MTVVTSPQSLARQTQTRSAQQGNRRARAIATAGDTIYGLAQQYLGSSDLWRELATFNNIDILEQTVLEGEIIIPNQQDLKDMAKAFARSSITDLTQNFLNTEAGKTLNKTLNTISQGISIASRLQTVIDGEPNQTLLDLSRLSQVSSGEIDSLIDWIIP